MDRGVSWDQRDDWGSPKPPRGWIPRRIGSIRTERGLTGELILTPLARAPLILAPFIRQPSF
jgi:hypothetical protein